MKDGTGQDMWKIVCQHKNQLTAGSRARWGARVGEPTSLFSHRHSPDPIQPIAQINFPML